MLRIPADDARAAAIVAAIQSGDAETLQRELRANPDLAMARIVDDRGVARTLLHIVADWPGHFPNGSRIVAALIAAGADADASVVHAGPNGLPKRRCTGPRAVMMSKCSTRCWMAGRTSKPPGAVFTGGPPMSDAVVFAQWRAARRLLERGARTTIWQAAALGLLDRVEGFCSETPPPTVEHITNALWHACRGGQRAVAGYLLARGADRNWIGYDHKKHRLRRRRERCQRPGRVAARQRSDESQ